MRSGIKFLKVFAVFSGLLLTSIVFMTVKDVFATALKESSNIDAPPQSMYAKDANGVLHSVLTSSNATPGTAQPIRTTRTMGQAAVSWSGNATTLNVSNNAAGYQYSDSWDGSTYSAQGWRATTNSNGVALDLMHCIVTPTAYTANSSCYAPDDLASLTSNLTTANGAGAMPFEPAVAYRIRATISGAANNTAVVINRTYQE